jgi:hypothetical protein
MLFALYYLLYALCHFTRPVALIDGAGVRGWSFFYQHAAPTALFSATLCDYALITTTDNLLYPSFVTRGKLIVVFNDTIFNIQNYQVI